MFNWKEKATKIAQVALEQFGMDEEEALKFICVMARDCDDVIHTDLAYQVVDNAGNTDSNVFFLANEELVRRKWDRIHIDANETIDNVILRLAYLIVKIKAEEEYNRLFIENTKIKEVVDETL